MPDVIKKANISFSNDNKAVAVFPTHDTNAQKIVDVLALPTYKAVLLVIGGADGIDATVKPRLIQLFGRGIARAAANACAVIIDGGTHAGVMEMMGQGVADRGFLTPLIGIAPRNLVTYPGAENTAGTNLDPNHSHFVLVEGDKWGSEQSTLFGIARFLTTDVPSVVILVSGGSNARNELLQAVRRNLKVIVIEGSGGVADEVVAACKQRPATPEDPLMAEIIAEGRLEFHQLSNSVKGMERLVIRELGGDEVLMQAWERFADFDLNAILQQKRFDLIHKWILGIGLFGTALALIKQVFHPSAPAQILSSANFGDVWWYVYFLLIFVPITLSILISASHKFKQGNKWLVLRSGAESIKREIYKYRARAENYKEDGKAPSPEQRLAKNVEDVTRRTMQTEVNTSALVPYLKENGIPPKFTVHTGDDGFSLLTPDRYVEVRLDDQSGYFSKKTRKLEKQLKICQWLILIIGGAGTFLAAVNLQVWIALSTAVVAAIATFLGYRQTESSLTKYNQAKTDLDNVKAWWTALSSEEQSSQDNVDLLVYYTEVVLKSELDGWVQQMQNALAELRKEKTGAEEQGTKSEKSGATEKSAPTQTEKAGNKAGAG